MSELMPRTFKMFLSQTHVWAPVSGRQEYAPSLGCVDGGVCPAAIWASVRRETIRVICLGFFGGHGVNLPSVHSMCGMAGVDAIVAMHDAGMSVTGELHSTN